MLDATESDSGSARRIQGIRSAIRDGAHELAAQLLKQWLAKEPERGDLHVLLGVALEQDEQIADAKASYLQALQLMPADPAPLLHLHRLAARERRPAEEVRLLRSALALNPNDEKSLRRLLEVEWQTRDFESAARTAERLLVMSPGDAQIVTRRVWSLYESGRSAEAAAALDRLIREPDPPDAYILAWAELLLDRQGRPLEAESHLRTLCIELPNRWVNWACLGKTLVALEREEEALAAFRRSVEIDPKQASIWFDIATLERQSGRLAESKQALERCLQLQPTNVGAIRVLGYDHRYAYGDEAFQRVNRVVAGIGDFPQREQVEVHYAAAKAFEDVGELDTSFIHYGLAGQLQKQLAPWTELRMKGVLALMRQFMSRADLAAVREQGAPTNRPVFVFGMPRSGTTLIEQVIASHQQAFGAGELTLGGALIHGAKVGRVTIETTEKAGAANFSVPPRQMSIRQRGEAYLSELDRIAGANYVRVVDKMPGNYHWIGLLDAILPGCFLIHSRRHPVETCLSAYRIFFPMGIPFSYDLRDLGRAYRQYVDYVNYWFAMLPRERILHVRYEDIVADLETQARRLIRFVDLPWDEACIRFHESERKVKTASVAQVRRPIYTDSINRWRKYERHLKPLLDELGPLVREYEDELVGARPSPFG